MENEIRNKCLTFLRFVLLNSSRMEHFFRYWHAPTKKVWRFNPSWNLAGLLDPIFFIFELKNYAKLNVFFLSLSRLFVVSPAMERMKISKGMNNCIFWMFMAWINRISIGFRVEFTLDEGDDVTWGLTPEGDQENFPLLTCQTFEVRTPKLIY